MRLIELTANMSSFRTVTFNPSGPSFVVARQKDPESSDREKTYNGVGKSLIIALIHFCLGSSNRDEFESALPGWIFSLQFAIGNTEYTATRATEKQDTICLNGKNIKPAQFNSKLATLCFDIPNDTKFLSWRTLLPAFLRSNRTAYIHFDTFGGTRNNDQKQMVNCFLLGLDVNLVTRKLAIRQEQLRIQGITSNFKKDKILREFLSGNRDISLSIRELGDQIEQLENNLERFEVAEDYFEIKTQADETQRLLQKISNRIVLLQAQVSAIDKSLQFFPDLGREKIEKIYNEASLNFPESVRTRLDDVENFHKQLAFNREKRLSEQKTRIVEKIKQVEDENVRNKKRLDELLQFLGAHQALDVFVKLSNRLSELKSKLSNLESYNKLQSEYRRLNREVKEDFLKENQRTEDYMDETRSMLDMNSDFFRRLSKRFYPGSPAGIKAIPNEKENKIRFDLDARIESDSSGGINNVKIFCYDLTLLFQRHNHHMNFVFHDSRLFDGVDERQKTEMVEVIDHLFSNSENQYIVTMNENQLEEVRRHLPSHKFEEIIERNTVLTLTDGSPSEKLLGINVDLRYD